MKLLIENTKILSSEKIGHNFQDWSAFQNCYNIKCFNNDEKFPKYLIHAAIREFNSIAETYFMDASKFNYLRVTHMDCIWQVDFHTDEDATGPHVSLHEIYYNSKRKVIMQRFYSIS